MLCELVAAGAGYELECALEAVVVEHLDSATFVADEVVVMLPARKRGLEARHAATQIYPVHESEFGQPVEHAVDARYPDLAPVRPQPVVELLGGDAAVLALQVRDHRLACAARARARASQLGADMLSPGSTHR